MTWGASSTMVQKLHELRHLRKRTAGTVGIGSSCPTARQATEQLALRQGSLWMPNERSAISLASKACHRRRRVLVKTMSDR